MLALGPLLPIRHQPTEPTSGQRRPQQSSTTGNGQDSPRSNGSTIPFKQKHGHNQQLLFQTALFHLSIIAMKASTFALALLSLPAALLAQSTPSTIPACLLSCVATSACTTPGDLACQCGTQASAIQSCLGQRCATDTAALAFLQAQCASAGQSVTLASSVASSAQAATTSVPSSSSLRPSSTATSTSSSSSSSLSRAGSILASSRLTSSRSSNAGTNTRTSSAARTTTGTVRPGSTTTAAGTTGRQGTSTGSAAAPSRTASGADQLAGSSTMGFAVVALFAFCYMFQGAGLSFSGNGP